MTARNHTVVSIGVLFLAWTVLANATDGVLEINHTCATNGGCFSGDAVGYPVTIDGTAGGSYRLTSNLIIPDVNTHGVLVVSPAISIDLNGFEIRRSGCVETELSGCFPLPVSGTGYGIYSDDSGYRGISVKNGSIVGMGSGGVRLRGDYSEVKNMRVRWNRTVGIDVGFHGNATGNILYFNGGAGIAAQVGGVISGNNVRDCGGDGIEAGYGSVVTGNVSIGNGGAGIKASSTGLVISGNTAHNNSIDGIFAFGDSSVQNNTVRGNTGYGLNLQEDTAYSGNVIGDNTAGTVNGGFNMGGNFCDTNDTCP